MHARLVGGGAWAGSSQPLRAQHRARGRGAAHARAESLANIDGARRHRGRTSLVGAGARLILGGLAQPGPEAGVRGHEEVPAPPQLLHQLTRVAEEDVAVTSSGSRAWDFYRQMSCLVLISFS